MSTKIYNGYRLPGDVNLPASARVLNGRFDEVFRPLALQAVAFVATLLIGRDSREKVSSVLDALTAGQVKSADLHVSWHGTVLHQAAEIVDLAQEALRRPHALAIGGLDLTFSAAVLSDPQERGSLYAVIYTEQDAYRDAWESTTGAKPYPYWDDADLPREVTMEEWKERRITWERVLPGTAPARVGVCWEFRPGRDLVWSSGRDGWLTTRKVLDAMSELSDDPAAFDTRREWYSERLLSPACPLLPGGRGAVSGRFAD